MSPNAPSKTDESIRMPDGYYASSLGSNFSAAAWRAKLRRVIPSMILAAGLDPTRLMVTGHADTQPRVANDTPANRAINRRVDVTFANGRDRPARWEDAAPPRAGSMNEDNVLTFRDFRYAWLAAVLALNTGLRSDARPSAVIRTRLGAAKELSVLPCPTRFGMVTIAFLNAPTIPDDTAASLREALALCIEGKAE